MMTPYGGAPSPGRKPRLLDEAQEQLLDEILMSVNLAVMEGRLSLSSAQGALDMAGMRLEAIVVEAMASDVDELMGADPDDEPDVNAFLRRPAGDAEPDA